MSRWQTQHLVFAFVIRDRLMPSGEYVNDIIEHRDYSAELSAWRRRGMSVVAIQANYALCVQRTATR